MSTGIGVAISSAFGGVKASPSFEYSASAFCGNASDPTPTINGTPGGVFTSAPVSPHTGTLVINSSTGEVDLSASDVGNYLVTYTVAGVSESDPFEVLAVQTTGFSYSASSFQQTGTTSPTITGSSGGVFTATTGLSINSSTGVIDLASSTIGGPYTVTYTNTGACQGTPSTFDVSITAAYISTSSFLFDGINDYFVGPKIGFGTNNFSISLWVNYSYGAGNARFNTLIDFRETAYNVNGLSFSLFENKASVYIGGVGTVGTSTITLSQNLWTNIILTKTSGQYKIYFNDSNSSRSEVLGTNTTSLDEKTGNIGIEWDESFGPFNGLMDELSIWNTALSSDAVTEIYNSGAPNDLTTLTNASNTNLKAWYKF